VLFLAGEFAFEILALFALGIRISITLIHVFYYTCLLSHSAALGRFGFPDLPSGFKHFDAEK